MSKPGSLGLPVIGRSSVPSAGQNAVTAAAPFGNDFEPPDLSPRLDAVDLLGWQHDAQLSFDVSKPGKAKPCAYFQFTTVTYNEYAPGRSDGVGVRARFRGR